MTKKSELSLMWQMKREAERDFNKFIKYVAELEKENKELQGTLEHRDSILSVMWDLVRTTITTDEDIIKMIKAVVDVECWAPISKKEEKLVEKFWNREF